MTTCRSCGTASPTGWGYVRGRCGWCAARPRPLAPVAALLLLGVAGGVLGESVLAGVLVLLSVPVSIAAHEGVHALVARALGLEVLRVVLGAGPVVWRRGVVEVRAWPSGGGTVAPPHVAGAPSARRTAAVAASGPLTHVLLGAVLWAGPDVLAPAALLQAVLAVGNAWPFRTGDQLTDGRRVLGALLDGAGHEALLALGYAQECLRRREVDDAATWLAAVRGHVLDRPEVRRPAAVLSALVALHRGDRAAASAAREAVPVPPALSTPDDAVAWNDAAYVDLLLGERLDAAHSAARRAWEALPWHPATCSTLALSAALQGRTDDLPWLLGRARERTEDAALLHELDAVDALGRREPVPPGAAQTLTARWVAARR